MSRALSLSRDCILNSSEYEDVCNPTVGPQYRHFRFIDTVLRQYEGDRDGQRTLDWATGWLDNYVEQGLLEMYGHWTRQHRGRDEDLLLYQELEDEIAIELEECYPHDVKPMIIGRLYGAEKNA